MQDQRKILIIEDDESVREVVAHHLKVEGFMVDHAVDGVTGLEKALSAEYALIILDLQLPRLSGIEICKEIRRQRETQPLLMLTSRDSEMDRVVGLEVGADDYVVKPFSIYELMARIRARLRIASFADSTPISKVEDLHCGQINLSPEKREVSMNGVAFEVTRTEFDVLEHLLRNSGRAITRSELLEAVWGTTVPAYEDTVTTIVGRLRRKLEAAAPDKSYLRTIRGVGFMLDDSDTTSGNAGSDSGDDSPS